MGRDPAGEWEGAIGTGRNPTIDWTGRDWTRRMAEPGDSVALWSESIVQRIVGSREEEFAGGVGRECVEKSRKGA